MTDLVEEAVLKEFERISERGGVLGAMETGYQRGKIQDESLHYETLKHDGTYPIIGVNTFEEGVDNSLSVEEFDIEVTRSDKEERMMVIDRNKAFKETHAKEAEEGLARLKQVAREGGNLFEVMMEIVEHCTVGQVTQALFETGGKFRRNM